MNLNVHVLKEKESANIDRAVLDITNMLREKAHPSCELIFCIAHLAIIAADEHLEDGNSLKQHIETMEASAERDFILSVMQDECWETVIECKTMFDYDTLIAIVLWTPDTMNKPHGLDGTPPSLTKLAYHILEPHYESVADFCCGAGAFLTYMAGVNNTSSYYGVEINATRAAMASIRLQYLSDRCRIDCHSVFDLDSNHKFDKIFCEAPFRVRIRNTDISDEALAALGELLSIVKESSFADWCYVAKVLSHLNDGGKAVIILPSGAMFNGGPEKQIRKQLIQLGVVETIISLPGNLHPFTAVATTMMVLSKSHNEEIRMIDATGFATKGRRKNELDDAAIESIGRLYAQDGEQSVLVSHETLADNDYILYPPQYLQKKPVIENGVPLGDLIVSVRRGAQLKAAALDEMVSKQPTAYQYLSLSDIQDGMICESLPYLMGIEKKLEKYCIPNQSLLISKNGQPVKIAIAKVEAGHYLLANGNLYVIELDTSRVNPYFVKAYLESDDGAEALLRCAKGAIIPTIPVEELKKLIIPLPAFDIQSRVAEKYQAKMDEIVTLKHKLQKASADLKSVFQTAAE